MYETSKAVMRRLHDIRFATRYFVGHGVDIGSGPDPLGRYAELFPLMLSCREWDRKDGDAQLLADLDDHSLDFIHSSHCLEHMRDPHEALMNWLRVLKPGGHLVVIVPDEDLYEQGLFPSSWNNDHKWTFTLYKTRSWSSCSINILTLLSELSDSAQILKIEQLDATYRFSDPVRSDQTVGPVGEAAVEFVLRKRTSEELRRYGRYPEPEATPDPENELENAIATAQKYHDAFRFQEAEALYRKILAVETGSAELHKNHGNTLLSMGNLAEAETAYRRALELRDDFGEAWNNLGNVLLLMKHPDQAEDAFMRALALLPDRAEIQNNLGNLFIEMGRFEEAEQAYRRAVVLKPDYATAYCNRANALRVLGKRETAEKAYRRALQLKPDYPEASTGLGQTLAHLGRLDEAEQAFCHALSIRPDLAAPHCGLGNVYQESGDHDRAREAYLQSLNLNAGEGAAAFGLSLLDLLQGHYIEGFKGFEKRFEGGSPASFRLIREQIRQLNCLPWDGEPLAGKSLLVMTEQGAGDSIMMMRYLPLLRKKGASRLTVWSDPRLSRLIGMIAEVDAVFPMTGGLPEPADFYCPIMSLPHLFNTELQTIPAAVPYVTVPPELVATWKSRIQEMPGLKVGVAWAGNRQLVHDKRRSIDPAQLLPLIAVDGVCIFSLCKDEATVAGMLDWMAECGDFLDTAALISAMDLVITVDTSIAHLAGALGKPVWLLNRHASEWRWLLDREDSPWYPTMRIFRQKVPGEWDTVIDRAALALRDQACQGAGFRGPKGM